MVPRPVHLDGEEWKTWLVQDQRFAVGQAEPDDLEHVVPALKADLHALAILHLRGSHACAPA
jgi:hypothetical protein